MNLDSKGLIVQLDGDAGDCLQREGFWYEGVYYNTPPVIPGLATYATALLALDTPQGFVRSWMPGTSIPPWNDPTDTSRDQLVSNIRACGYYQYRTNAIYILKACLKNWSRFPNGDIAFLNDYARFFRALGWWWTWPLLFLFDFIIIVNSIIRIVQGEDYNNVGDDINHIGDLAQSNRVYPTGVSWLARKIYIWFRPAFVVNADGSVSKSYTENGAAWALKWYFRPEAKGNIEFANLWVPVVEKW